MALSQISLRILEVLKGHPEGLTAGQIRRELELAPDEQSQLDRRRRDLYPEFQIDRLRQGNDWVYVYRGTRSGQSKATRVSARARAQVLHEAGGRCGMCGRSIREHGITLVVDHRLPQEWGGTSEIGNLWALCEDCNGGKKNLFASVDAEMMKEILASESVHVRIGELLKAHLGRPVPPWLLSFISGGQDDWKKRLRELRYLGWKIDVVRRRTEFGKVTASYVLRSFTAWPQSPSDWIRRFEADRAKDNRTENGPGE